MLKLLLALVMFSSNFPPGLSRNIDDIIDLSHFGSKIFGKPIENDGRSLRIKENPEEDGPYLEGDLLIPSSDKNGMTAESLRWRNGEIPYQITGSFTAQNVELIQRAMNEYHAKTCIKFIPRRSSDRDYITIESGNSGCWSSVGRIGGKQTVNLQSPGCVRKVGTVLHELLHAAGFLHEQNREERDDFVRINSRNIRSGYEINFNKAKKGEATGFGVRYDYGSVMHYSTTAFSKNGEPTIEPKMNTNDVIGQREGFSKSDTEKVNRMYKCNKVAATNVVSSTPQPEGESSTTRKPSDSIFTGIIDAFFPNRLSSMDEEEMVNE